MAAYSKKLLEKTIKVWQPYYSQPLTLEDAREIIDNLTEFMTVLAELDKKYGKGSERLEGK